MINGMKQASRKAVEVDRIAICPHFGCYHLKKIKSLKFGGFGFGKYPKCSKHRLHLVFVDEFIAHFFRAIIACFFDKESAPPEQILNALKTRVPDDLKHLINAWMYCISIGKGAQIISRYMNGLSRGYMKVLSRKQRKLLRGEKK